MRLDLALREADYLVNTGWIRWSCYTWANDDDQQHCVRLSVNRELCPLGRIMPAGTVTGNQEEG